MNKRGAARTPIAHAIRFLQPTTSNHQAQSTAVRRRGARVGLWGDLGYGVLCGLEGPAHVQHRDADSACCAAVTGGRWRRMGTQGQRAVGGAITCFFCAGGGVVAGVQQLHAAVSAGSDAVRAALRTRFEVGV